jgi:signal transduction histidine kinase
VTDVGPGIDPAECDEIFERFHQVDQSSTRAHDGLGLGLHLAKELAEQLRGRVDVDSTPGHGSTFTVTVPTDAAPADPVTVANWCAASDEGRQPVPAMNAEIRATSCGIWPNSSS